jgi:hypothetical protein
MLRSSRQCGNEVEWPTRLACRHTNARAGSEAKDEMRWFFQALLLRELRAGLDMENLSESRAETYEQMAGVVDGIPDSAADFPAGVRWAVDCQASTYGGGSTCSAPVNTQTSSLNDTLLNIAGFVDETTAGVVRAHACNARAMRVKCWAI